MKALVSLLLFCSSLCWGQSAVDAVNVFVSATDKHNRALTQLTPSDLTISDGQHAGSVLDVRKFDGPIHFCVLLDTSNSKAEDFRFEQKLATEFLTKVPRRNKDTTVVLAFDTEIVASRETANAAELAEFVQSSRAGGATALFDAMAACAHRLESAPPGELRVVVVLTDGEDNASKRLPDQAAEEVLATGARVYVFWIRKPNAAPSYLLSQARALDLFTNSTGGVTYAADVDRPMQKLQAALQTLYAVSYRPATTVADRKLHRIVITTSRDVRVSAPVGYLATTK